MTAVEPGPAPALKGLVDRVKGILLNPDTEWDVIEKERPTLGALFTGYVLPLAAIPAVAQIIGSLAFGYGGFVPLSLADAVKGALLTFIGGLAGVYVGGIAINFLAPNFGGQKDEMQGFKTAAYSATALFVAGIFAILPQMPVLQLLGLFSIFLLYKGLPKLMKAPVDRSVGYAAAVVITAVVLGVVLLVLASCAGMMIGGVARLDGPHIAAASSAAVALEPQALV
jgi:hypothetical protein